MSVSESDRSMVYRAFSDQLSQPVAEIVMELLFTQPTGELATQADLHANTTLLRGEIAEFRSEVRGEIAEFRSEVRGEIAEFRSEVRGEITELRGEITGLRNEMRAEIDGVRGEVTGLRNEIDGEFSQVRGEIAELRGELKAEIGNLYRWGAGVMVANGVAVITALVM